MGVGATSAGISAVVYFSSSPARDRAARSCDRLGSGHSMSLTLTPLSFPDRSTLATLAVNAHPAAYSWPLEDITNLTDQQLEDILQEEDTDDLPVVAHERAVNAGALHMA